LCTKTTEGKLVGVKRGITGQQPVVRQPRDERFKKGMLTIVDLTDPGVYSLCSSSRISKLRLMSVRVLA